ncbi:MaoC family dehydratase [Clostridium tetani]|uniref:Enoyl-CoA hydratase n=1 Tax=Clostridium tetani TaxID=1513 RepID=A0ABY0ESX3_CLOTA|nr:MaoC family dehydratase [Clostridium tetani]CDI48761.1 (de)hydratase [Clostridium tetani 12124569]KHO39930.1 enoyl-CoA hydratase [Clostridium tetani]RXI41821.1 enoyl-CoA hydratase [Clostridium tetani]RXI57136.1 enoyl-CoA hydratase [Clostridium tetani]RXI67222.1 enoyl-CoA hydratase [Clostridium tetani]
MVGKTIETIKIGDKASFTKTLTETDVYLFAGISGDLNPAHVNQIEAEKTMFKGRICHGILVSSLISTVLGMYLPGPGTIYLSQDLKFVAPVKIGDTVTATVEVIERNEERNRLILKTVVINEDGKVVVEGQAKVMPPKK